VDDNVRMQFEMQKFWEGDGWKHQASPSSSCQHCYCLHEPPSTWRPLPHAKCCKCGDVRLQGGMVICG